MCSGKAIGRAEQVFARVLPDSARVAVRTGGSGEPPLLGDEVQAVARAVPKRRLEFARGRACAREALAKFGASPSPIPVGPSREPVWPDGFTGSITHCDGLVGAAVARLDDLPALGIDAEVLRPFDDDTASLVLTTQEVQGATEEDPRRLVVFSAKEAVFKAVFPMTRKWLDFLDVRVRADWHLGTFRVDPAREGHQEAPLAALRGQFVVTERFVMTACWLPAPARGAARS